MGFQILFFLSIFSNFWISNIISNFFKLASLSTAALAQQWKEASLETYICHQSTTIYQPPTKSNQALSSDQVIRAPPQRSMSVVCGSVFRCKNSSRQALVPNADMRNSEGQKTTMESRLTLAQCSADRAKTPPTVTQAVTRWGLFASKDGRNKGLHFSFGFSMWNNK